MTARGDGRDLAEGNEEAESDEDDRYGWYVDKLLDLLSLF